MENYQREREQQIEEMIPVVGVFTLLFMCIALLNLPFRSTSTPFLSFALVPFLIYLLVFRVGNVWQIFMPNKETGDKKVWYDYVKLVGGMGLVAVMVYITGGTHSNYKLLFLPVILVFSLRYGLAWGAAASSLAGAAIFWFAWSAGAGTDRNLFLEADLVIIGIFFLVNWLVAKAYQELIHSFVIIERSEKLAAVGKMTAITAHEIRNPLTTLRGCVQIMEYSLRNRDPEWYSEQAETFQIMLTEIDRMNSIVSDMLLFSRPVPPRQQVVNLNQIVKEMGVILNSRARLNGVELQVQPCSEAQLVSVDPDQIKQVIHNIVGNAFEAMPAGGVVQMIVKKKGRRVQLLISDNGPGIPAEKLSRIFEPFYSSGKNGSSGLGLAISHRLVQGNGGKLSVSSEVGRGTTFTIDLPVAINLVGKKTIEYLEGKSTDV